MHVHVGFLAVLLLTGCAPTVPLALEAGSAAAEAPAPVPPDPGWMGPGVHLTKGDGIDWVWVKPGFSAQGHGVRVGAWEPPALPGRGKDVYDAAQAARLTETLPQLLMGMAPLLKEGTGVSRTSGELLLTGRIIGCRYFRHAEGQTFLDFELRLQDSRTGETLVALQHRTLGGKEPGAGIENCMMDWLPALARLLA